MLSPLGNCKFRTRVFIMKIMQHATIIRNDKCLIEMIFVEVWVGKGFLSPSVNGFEYFPS